MHMHMHMHMHVHTTFATCMHMHIMSMHMSCARAGSYLQPLAAGESSVIGTGGWISLKRIGNNEHRCWLQIDAG